MNPRIHSDNAYGAYYGESPVTVSVLLVAVTIAYLCVCVLLNFHLNPL